MSPSHAFLILAGITLALAAIGAAIAYRLVRRAGKSRGAIVEHSEGYWS